MRVGFIGLGSQGGPMARRIVEGGYELTLWARRPASVEPYADTAAKVAATPAELGAASDLVCLCVVGDDDVRQVILGEHRCAGGHGARRASSPFTAPCTPTPVARSPKLAAAQGVSVIDAPVSGGAPAVAEGTLHGHGRRRGGRRREGPAGVRHLLRRDRAPRRAGRRSGRQDPEQPSVHRQPGQRDEHAGARRRAGHRRGSGSARCSTAGPPPARRSAASPCSAAALEGLAPIAGALLQKDVRHAASLADKASAPEGSVFNAADTALASMDPAR